MTNPSGEIRIEETEAKAATSTGTMRWVLGISLLLAIIAMSVTWIIPALAQ